MSSFESLNLIKSLLETELFGSTLLFGLFITAFLILLLLVTKNYAEVVILIPLPVLYVLAINGIIPNWVLPLLLMITGIFFAIALLLLFQMIRK